MLILHCEAFDDEPSSRFDNKCCKGDCHEKQSLINVTPYAEDATLENRRLDWSLGIQGLVCCGRYEFVRSLSREWWINKLKSMGGWTPTFDDARSKLKLATNRSQRPSKANKCPNCGSTWNEVVCDDCGYSN